MQSLCLLTNPLSLCLTVMSLWFQVHCHWCLKLQSINFSMWSESEKKLRHWLVLEFQKHCLSSKSIFFLFVTIPVFSSMENWSVCFPRPASLNEYKTCPFGPASTSVAFSVYDDVPISTFSYTLVLYKVWTEYRRIIIAIQHVYDDNDAAWFSRGSSINGSQRESNHRLLLSV